jgi:hypothetical protein
MRRVGTCDLEKDGGRWRCSRHRRGRQDELLPARSATAQGAYALHGVQNLGYGAFRWHLDGKKSNDTPG